MAQVLKFRTHRKVSGASQAFLTQGDQAEYVATVAPLIDENLNPLAVQRVTVTFGAGPDAVQYIIPRDADAVTEIIAHELFRREVAQALAAEADRLIDEACRATKGTAAAVRLVRFIQANPGVVRVA